MNIRPNLVTMTVADYCNAYKRREVRIDRKYQRNSSIWPLRARSYLIETILRGFPMPKLALHQQTDVKSRKTTKFVVDGQQRTDAIVDFFEGQLSLSSSIEMGSARGKIFANLDEDLQEAFLSYPLQFDQFEAADEDVVREYYRRINSFTSPLNAEERRHARFQGNMKWFILKLAERHTDTLVALRTLSEKEVIRMADHKLFAEIVHATLHSVRTTNSTTLDTLYREHDVAGVPEEGELLLAIDSAFSRIVGWRDLALTSLIQKTHIFYSLMLAIIGVERKWPRQFLQDIDSFSSIVETKAEQNLLELNEALNRGERTGPFKGFIEASSEKTNTKEQREERIKWLATALTQSNT